MMSCSQTELTVRDRLIACPASPPNQTSYIKFEDIETLKQLATEYQVVTLILDEWETSWIACVERIE